MVFRNHLFPFSGEKEPTWLGPAIKVAFSNGIMGTSPPSRVRVETDPLPKIFLIWSTEEMADVHTLNYPKCKIC
jgi:hypothetical protein